jgi:hypothetical protein
VQLLHALGADFGRISNLLDLIVVQAVQRAQSEKANEQTAKPPNRLRCDASATQKKKGKKVRKRSTAVSLVILVTRSRSFVAHAHRILVQKQRRAKRFKK